MKLRNIFIACAAMMAPAFMANATGITEKAVGLKKGEHAPMIKMADHKGEEFDMAAALKKGKVVVVFYRGQWCPYCNKQMSALQDSLPMIEGKKATLVVVTPEVPESVDKTIEKTKATYHIISDKDYKVMTAYKVAYKLSPDKSAMLKKYGVDLAKNNGNEENVLPVPATYVINSKGVVEFVQFNEDYTKRASVKEIIAYL